MPRLVFNASVSVSEDTFYKRKVCLGMIVQPSFPSADLGGSSNFVDESSWTPSS